MIIVGGGDYLKHSNAPFVSFATASPLVINTDIILTQHSFRDTHLMRYGGVVVAEGSEGRKGKTLHRMNLFPYYARSSDSFSWKNAATKKEVLDGYGAEICIVWCVSS